MKRSSAVRGDRGATAVEYALVASLIAVVALVGIVYVGRNLAGSFEESTLAIGAAVNGGGTGTDTGGTDTGGTDTGGTDTGGTDTGGTDTGGTDTGGTDTGGTDTGGTDTGGNLEPVVVAQPQTVAPPLAQWRQSPGEASGQYEWVCANGYSLGNAKAKKKSATPPSTAAPSCG